jgi:uncharacterized protein (DUF2141 family)
VAAFALVANRAQAQDCDGAPSTARLLITVEGVKSDSGLMTATLYPNDKRRFLVKNGALKVWRNRSRAPKTEMCTWLPSPGIYAVGVYHDANAHLKFEVGPLGPTEGYGFTNNPRILFSKPSLDSVRFYAHPGDNMVRVKLHYPP